MLGVRSCAGEKIAKPHDYEQVEPVLCCRSCQQDFLNADIEQRRKSAREATNVTDWCCPRSTYNSSRGPCPLEPVPKLSEPRYDYSM